MTEGQTLNQLGQESPRLTGPTKYLEAANTVTDSGIRALPPIKRSNLKRLRNKAGLTIATVALLANLGCGANIAPATQEQQYLHPATPIETPVSTIEPPKIDKYKYKDKLPEDIVPDEELEKYNVRIYNPPTIKFHFRRAALSELNFFKDASNPLGFRSKTFKNSFNIFIVDGPVVDPYYLTEEQRQATGIPWFQEYKPLTQGEVISAKEKWIQMYGDITNEQILNLKNKLESGEIDDQYYQDSVTELKAALQRNTERFSRVKDEEDLVLETTNRRQGAYLSSMPPVEGENTLDIFICVRYAPPKGKSPNYYIERGFTTKPLTIEDTFTSPDDLNVDPNAEAYPVGPQTVPFIGHHELRHPDIKDFGPDASRIERKVELQALEDIKKAHQELLKKGNDSLYWAVFETPEGNIVSKNLKATAQEPASLS